MVKIIDEDNGKTAEYLIGLWIVLGIIPNTVLTAANGFEKYDMLNRYVSFFSSFSFLSGNHIGYFVLGRYLSGKRLSKEKRAVIYALGILATVILYVLTDWYSHYAGYGDNRWLSTLNIFVLIQAASLFILFSNITIKGKSAAVIKRLSKYTFGIYLIHVFFLDWSYTLGIFPENGIWKYAVNPILNTPMRVMIIYVASFLCVFLVKKAMNGLKSL